jgi:hypothetical protein
MARKGLRQPKLSWMMINGVVYCYENPDDLQVMAKFKAVKRLSSFHDAQLARCTKEVNRILDKVKRNNKNPKRELAILRTSGGLFLAWTEYGAVGPYDDDAEKRLGIK